MPPKKLITKEQIIEKAFQIVRTQGYDALSARSLAKELNCSTQPIYQAFSDMSSLKQELIRKAQQNLMEYSLLHSEETLPANLASILSYIRFAKEERNLFQLIFASGGLSQAFAKDQMPQEIGKNLDMIIYANGIIMMSAFHTLDFPEETIRKMVINAYNQFMYQPKDNTVGLGEEANHDKDR